MGVQALNEAALIRQYERLAYWAAREFYLPGADRDDVNQEALLAALAAIRTHNPALGSLGSFVVLCVRRRLSTLLKNATREKRTAPEGSEVVVYGPDPAEVAERRDEIRRLFTVVRDDLTPLERDCVVGLAAGMSYAELDTRHRKTADNAIQRARRKLRAAA